MSESQYVECNPSRTFTPSTFSSGSLEIPFNVGVPAAWIPSKSYVRIGLTLKGTGDVAPSPSQLVALADNVAGNIFSNAYLRIQGQATISQCTAGLDRASALRARLENGNAWLKSIGAGSDLNIAKFAKRNMLTAASSSPDSYLGAENEMYRPVSAGNFANAPLTITPLLGTDNAGAVAFPIVQNGGQVDCPNALFNTGMPDAFSGAITGSPIRVGDVLVVNGVHYPVSRFAGSETQLFVANVPSLAIAANNSWYIIRKDMLRAPQAKNTIYVNYVPPIGIFDYTGHLGGGDYLLLLNPNSQYTTAAVETKNIDSLTGAALPFNLEVNSVKFYLYTEKMPIPAQVQELNLLEYQVQSKPFQSNLQFTVSPFTESLSFFVQDSSASYNPLVPPSMFKCYNNSDLRLKQIQCSYAGYTKPSTPWESDFYGTSNASADSFQQRYLSTYEENGSDLKAYGCESYDDYLTRGPFYHFRFPRDKDYRADNVILNLTFNNADPTSINGQPAEIYCISRYRTRVQFTTAAGRIVQAQMLGEV